MRTLQRNIKLVEEILNGKLKKNIAYLRIHRHHHVHLRGHPLHGHRLHNHRRHDHRHRILRLHIILELTAKYFK